jgi:hypothetical protein
VRQGRVELGRLTGRQRQVALADHQPLTERHLSGVLLAEAGCLVGETRVDRLRLTHRRQRLCPIAWWSGPEQPRPAMLRSPEGSSYRHWPFAESESSAGKPEIALRNSADTK